GRYDPLAALVRRGGADVDDELAVSIYSFVRDLAGELDDVRDVDELTVLRRARLDPAVVTGPAREVVHLPALALEPDVVHVLGAHRVRGLDVVVNRVDRLEGRRDGVTEGPCCMRSVVVQCGRGSL